MSSAEPGPKTFGISGLLFSSTALALATIPTSHPARVNETHAAGAFFPASVSMLGVVLVGLIGNVGSKIGSVQYANETAGSVLPSGLK